MADPRRSQTLLFQEIGHSSVNAIALLLERPDLYHDPASELVEDSVNLVMQVDNVTTKASAHEGFMCTLG
jgi:hypothetical protein